MADLWDQAETAYKTGNVHGAAGGATPAPSASDDAWKVWDTPQEQKAAAAPAQGQGSYLSQTMHNLLPSIEGVVKNNPLAPSDGPAPVKQADGSYKYPPIDPLKEVTDLAGHIRDLFDPSTFGDRFKQDPAGSVMYPLAILNALRLGAQHAPKVANDIIQTPGGIEKAAAVGAIPGAGAAFAMGHPLWAASIAAGGVGSLIKGIVKSHAATAADTALTEQAAAGTPQRTVPGIATNSFPQSPPMPEMPGLPPEGAGPAPNLIPSVPTAPEGYRPPPMATLAERMLNNQGTGDLTARPTVPGELPIEGPQVPSVATPPAGYKGPVLGQLAQRVLDNQSVGQYGVGAPKPPMAGLPPELQTPSDAAVAPPVAKPQEVSAPPPVDATDSAHPVFGEPLTSFDSSAIKGAAYHAPTQTQRIVLNNGRTLVHQGLPPELHQGLLDAESKGQYYNQNIRPRYSTKTSYLQQKPAGEQPESTPSNPLVRQLADSVDAAQLRSAVRQRAVQEAATTHGPVDMEALTRKVAMEQNAARALGNNAAGPLSEDVIKNVIKGLR